MGKKKLQHPSFPVQTAASMVGGALFTYPDNFRAQKAEIAAKDSGAKLTVSKDFKFGETNKSAEFLKKFPLGKVPAFEGSDGLLLTESNAIAYYVANDELRGGADQAARAQVVQWMAMADSDILPAACTWVFPTMGIMQYIAVCCTLLSLYKQVMDPSFGGAYQNVNKWFTTVVNQPNAKAVLGEVVLCSKEAQFDAKKFAEFSGKGDKKKEEKPKKEQQPKKEPEKKKEKPAEKAEEEDDGMPKEPKSKDPLAALPKGTFDLEEWKRFYSNNDEDDSIKWFWEHFDAEHYSIWRSDYKFNNELTMVFMSCNLVGGMFQRLEKMKKNAFASAILFGENNNSSISGIWVWKGQELAFDLCEDWAIDSGSYDWKKLDPKSDECKNLITQYWKWEGNDLEGRKFNQGKILK